MIKFCYVKRNLSIVTEIYTAAIQNYLLTCSAGFCEILAQNYAPRAAAPGTAAPGAAAPGAWIIWGNIFKFNMLQEHYLDVHCSRSIFRYALGTLCVLNMFLEHICNMLLEHCAFRYAPGAYLTWNITLDYSCSWSSCSWGSCPWSSCSWSII